MINSTTASNSNASERMNNESNMRKEGGIGGLAAASHIPDQYLSGKSLNADPNVSPLLSVLRRDSSASNSGAGPALQFENSANILDELEDSDDDAPRSGEKRSGRRKIKIEYIEDKSRRHITFSKRKAGIMKKAYELSTLTGTQVLLLVASETGHVYTFATPKLQPLITKQEGKNLIQACLNSPDHAAIANASHQGHSHSHSAHAHSHSHSHSHLPQNASVSAASLPVVDYPPGPFDADLTEEDLTARSASTSAAALHAYLPQSSSSGGSAASAAASVAAQVFMNPTAGQYSATSPSPFHQPTQSSQSAQQQQQNSSSSTGSAYWNTPGGMYAPIPSKSQQAQQHQQQQQQQQQQQMYHALLQQQQLYQQYHNQQQQQQQQQHQQMQQNQHLQHHQSHKSHDSGNDA